MTSPTTVQQTTFSIQRLNEVSPADAGDGTQGIIEICLVLNGKMVITGERNPVMLESNELYSHFRDKETGTDIKEGTEGYVIRFSKSLLYTGDHLYYCSLFAAFQALILRGDVIKPGPSFLKEGQRLCDMMHREYNHHNEFSVEILSGFLNIFVLHLMRESGFSMAITGNTGQHMLVRKFNALLEEHFKTNKKVSDYATLLSVSPNHLNGVIKQATGQSAGTLIRQRIVLEAVRQAKQKGASLKEVAYSLGFTDRAHFSRFFKKAAGKNFSEIRKSYFNNTVVPIGRD